jgi:cytochrome c-type biogenesis protein CcmH/NrfG
MNDPESNIAALKRQVDENAFDVVAISTLGEAYMAAGHFMDAVACFGRAIKEDSHPSDYLNQIYARTQIALQILDGKPPNGTAP